MWMVIVSHLSFRVLVRRCKRSWMRSSRASRRIQSWPRSMLSQTWFAKVGIPHRHKITSLATHICRSVFIRVDVAAAKLPCNRHSQDTCKLFCNMICGLDLPICVAPRSPLLCRVAYSCLQGYCTEESLCNWIVCAWHAFKCLPVHVPLYLPALLLFGIPAWVIVLVPWTCRAPCFMSWNNSKFGALWLIADGKLMISVCIAAQWRQFWVELETANSCLICPCYPDNFPPCSIQHWRFGGEVFWVIQQELWSGAERGLLFTESSAADGLCQLALWCKFVPEFVLDGGST